MEQLFFIMQKDKQIKRHIQLLRYINGKDCVMAELVNLLECTTPTLRKDISMLNQQLQPYGKIELSKNGNVHLSHPSYISTDSLITILIKQSLVYKIIDSIFHEKNWSIQKATFELAVSKSHLLQTIRHMKEGLEKFNISISTSPLAFSGKEEDIRIFLFNFFLSFGYRDIIIQDSTKYVKQFLAILTSPHSLPLHFCHFRLSIWVSILVTRWSYKQFVSFPNSLSQTLKEQLSDQKEFDTFNNSFQKLYQLPASEGLWTYFSSLYCIAYSDIKSHGLTTEDYVYQRNIQPQNVQQVQQFLATTFSQSMIENGDAKLIEAFLVNLKLLTIISPSFGILSSNLRLLVQETHHDIFQAWYDSLKDSEHFSWVLPYLVEDVAVSLTTLHASLLKKLQISKKLHILFAFQGEYGFDDYLVQISKVMLTQNVKADYFLEKVVDQQTVNYLNPDLIVSNYGLHLENTTKCPFIRLSNVPTLADWGEVRNKIESHLVAFN